MLSYRDITPSSLGHTLSQHNFCVATRKTFVVTHSRPFLAPTLLRHKNLVVTRGQGFLSRVHTVLSHPHRHSRAPGLCALSRHRVKGTLSRQTFSVATKDSKWAVAHSGLLHLQFSFFLSFPRHPKFQHRLSLLLLRQSEARKTCQNA